MDAKLNQMIRSLETNATASSIVATVITAMRTRQGREVLKGLNITERVCAGDEEAIKACEDISAYARKEQGRIVGSARERAKKAFEEANGCTRCGGRGWIVTWDTLDSLSGAYAEFGSCDKEGCNAKEGVFNHGVSYRYDARRGTNAKPLTKAEEQAVEDLEALEKATNTVFACYRDALEVEKGKIVKVIKGRKVKKGTIGKVFYRQDRGSYVSLGLIVDGEKVWTYEKNVVVLLKETAEDRAKEAAKVKGDTENKTNEELIAMAKRGFSSDWEHRFVLSVEKQQAEKGRLSWKQYDILKRIASKAA